MKQALLGLAVALFFSGVANAAESTQSTDRSLLNQGLSIEEREGLLARLSDEQVRELVWQLIQADAESTSSERALLAEVDMISVQFREKFAKSGEYISAVLSLPSVLLEAMVPSGRSAGDLYLFILFVALILGAGWLGQRIFIRVSHGIADSLNNLSGTSFQQRLGRRSLIFLYDLCIPIAFAISGYALFLIFYQGHEPNRFLIVSLIGGIFTAWVVIKLIHLVFSPLRSQSRLTPLNDEDSVLISTRLSWLAGLGSTVYFLSSYLTAISGFDSTGGIVAGVNLIGGTSFMIVTIVVMWQLRRPVSLLILSGNTAGVARKLFASVWPALGTTVVLVITLVGYVAALGLGRAGVLGSAFNTLLVLLLLLPLALGVMGPLIREWGQRNTSGSKTASDGTNARDGLVQLARLFVLAIAIIGLGRIWNVDLVAITKSNLGERISEAIVQILITLVLAHIAWTVVKRWIASQRDNDLHESDAATGGDPGGQGLSRVATVLPLIRGFLFVAIMSIAAMVMLASLGVNIGPLIAGASVLGLAIGFGAQSLVADIIAGIFFLVDDAFRKGEYIDVGGNTGTVEKISARSMQLRHHNGPVHTIPYSQISTLTNFSRDWVIMKFELRIPFEENVEKVRKLIKKVGERLLEDPEHGPEFLEPLKSQGVNRMDDSAFVVRCKFSTKPGKQWAIRRIAYAAIQEAFAEAGIKFAPKRVVVEAVTPEIAAAGAAAQLSQAQENHGDSER